MMEEHTAQAAQKRKKKWRLTSRGKVLIAIILTLALSTGLWCLALGGSGIAMVQTYLLARVAFVTPAMTFM